MVIYLKIVINNDTGNFLSNNICVIYDYDRPALDSNNKR